MFILQDLKGTKLRVPVNAWPSDDPAVVHKHNQDFDMLRKSAAAASEHNMRGVPVSLAKPRVHVLHESGERGSVQYAMRNTSGAYFSVHGAYNPAELVGVSYKSDLLDAMTLAIASSKSAARQARLAKQKARIESQPIPSNASMEFIVKKNADVYVTVPSYFPGVTTDIWELGFGHLIPRVDYEGIDVTEKLGRSVRLASLSDIFNIYSVDGQHNWDRVYDVFSINLLFSVIRDLRDEEVSFDDYVRYYCRDMFMLAENAPDHIVVPTYDVAPTLAGAVKSLSKTVAAYDPYDPLINKLIADAFIDMDIEASGSTSSAGALLLHPGLLVHREGAFVKMSMGDDVFALLETTLEPATILAVAHDLKRAIANGVLMLTGGDATQLIRWANIDSVKGMVVAYE